MNYLKTFLEQRKGKRTSRNSQVVSIQFLRFQTEINNLLKFNMVEELEITSNREVVQEYLFLTKVKKFGKGESACMAYCKFNEDVVGSSNLKDITTYCLANGIVYLTTMDFLVAAMETSKMTEAECDEFIYNVKLKRSKLPVDTMAEFFEKR